MLAFAKHRSSVIGYNAQPHQLLSLQFAYVEYDAFLTKICKRVVHFYFMYLHIFDSVRAFQPHMATSAEEAHKKICFNQNLTQM